MTRRRGPVGLGVAYLGLAFGWRTWVQWRRTGDTGFRLSRHAPPAARAASVLMIAGAGAGFVGSLRESRSSGAERVGMGVMALSLLTTLRAQMDMGASWRIGVDETEHTALVSDGLFALSRNPIFASMAGFGIGTALATPNPLTAVGAAALVAGVELQVRRVEEPYLAMVHGDEYRAYTERVGRFLPGIG